MSEIIISEKKNNTLLKRILNISLILLVSIAIIIVGFFILQKPYDTTVNTYENVTINEGETTEEIAENLYEKDIIGNKDIFVFLSKICRYEGKYQPGKYFLSPCMSFLEISNNILNGITTSNGYEIPAGLTVEQTAEALEQAGYCSKEEFMQIASEVDFSIFDFIDNSVSGPEKLEGYLFPGTYKMSKNANAAMIITTFLNEFGNSYTDEYKARAEELGLSTREVLIIASIIEKETSIDKEKASISAVIHNKLALHMNFEGGFPKYPLCSPSKKSIEAALYPEDCDNTYYVLNSKLNGTHVFTSDKDEYLMLKEEYENAYNEKKSSKEKVD